VEVLRNLLFVKRFAVCLLLASICKYAVLYSAIVKMKNIIELYIEKECA